MRKSIDKITKRNDLFSLINEKVIFGNGKCLQLSDRKKEEVGLKITETAHYSNTPYMYYTAIFHGCKIDCFQMKNCDRFSCFCSKHKLWVHVRTASVRRF